jgi:uncharacterized protein (DUF302 family)
MSYYFATTLATSFEEAVTRATDALQAEGFGVLTTIDVRETLAKKLSVDFRPYVILGACNPHFAHQALLAEEHIGTMLPCNVIVQDNGADGIEIAAVDPMASMQAIENPALGEIAQQVRERLKAVIEAL